MYRDKRNSAKVDFYVSVFRFESLYISVFNEYNNTLRKENPDLIFSFLHFSDNNSKGVGYYAWIMETLFDRNDYQQILFVEVSEE